MGTREAWIEDKLDELGLPILNVYRVTESLDQSSSWRGFSNLLKRNLKFSIGEATDEFAKLVFDKFGKSRPGKRSCDHGDTGEATDEFAKLVFDKFGKSRPGKRSCDHGDTDGRDTDGRDTDVDERPGPVADRKSFAFEDEIQFFRQSCGDESSLDNHAIQVDQILRALQDNQSILSLRPDMNLARFVLTLKRLGINDIVNFHYVVSPPAEEMANALQVLYALGALNHRGELTRSGRKMAEFPVDPMLSKAIIASDKYKCSDEIISIAAMLSVGGSIFYSPKDEWVDANSARMNFHSGNVGDHVALLKVYNSWKEHNYSSQWCYQNYIQVRSMKRARDIRNQLKSLLSRVEIEISSNLNNLDCVRKSILAGFFPHISKLEKHGLYRILKHGQTVHIHPMSGLCQELPRMVVFHEVVHTSKTYMRHVTEVSPLWVREVAPHYYRETEVDDGRKMPKCAGKAPLR